MDNNNASERWKEYLLNITMMTLFASATLAETKKQSGRSIIVKEEKLSNFPSDVPANARHKNGEFLTA